jgi:capsular exopolysaccharide synthesis family protein
VSALGEERQGTARYLQALAQHWPFILGSVALALVTALAFLGAAQPRYEAQADVLVTPVSADDESYVGIPVIRESGEGRSVLTAARLVETPQVADAVRARFGSRPAREELLNAVTVAPQAQSNIVTITGTGDNAEEAAAIANGFAGELIAERTRVFQRALNDTARRLSARLAALPANLRDVGEGRALSDRLATLRGLAGGRDPTLQLASLAVPPSESSWPRPVLSLAVALFAGLLLGIGIAIALELVNPLVLRDEDVLELGLPLLARVPQTSISDLTTDLEAATLPTGVRDAYRLVRVNLSSGQVADAQPHTILVTSAAQGDGTTAAAASLALAYALTDARVVLVDADFRRRRLTSALGDGSRGGGLGELLREETSVDDVLVPLYGDRLQLLAAGSEEGGAIDLLQSRRIEAVVEKVAAHADVVIFDSPPITEVADGLPLGAAVDAVVLVARLGRTRRDGLAAARLLLRQVGVASIGVIAVTRRRSGRQPRQGRATSRSATEQPLASLEESATRARSSAGSS